MGTPAHYSSELAERLGFLTARLYPIVTHGLSGDDAFGGALGTTFLLAMATPMIVLPMERILRIQEGRRAMANDDLLNPNLSKEIARIFADGKRFQEAPFVRTACWSYIASYPRFDVAQQWPAGLLMQLGSEPGRAGAAAVSTRRAMRDLRNALSHGGVTYLNAKGEHVYGDRVEMLAFAADEALNNPNYNVIRISEADFRQFLMDWSAWLSSQ